MNRNTWTLAVTPLLGMYLVLIPPGAFDLREEPCTQGCLGCKNVELMGETHHQTSSEQVYWGCVNRGQLEGHGNNQGCDTEPHENLCIEGCIASHGLCEPAEEDLLTLAAAAADSDIAALRRALLRIRAPVQWNEHRSAIQVSSRCSPGVVLHTPVPAEIGRNQGIPPA